MSRRRALPAPPLVIKPVFLRVPVGSPQGDFLLELAAFLGRRGLLTDGGKLKLSDGLQGRNSVLSLTLQDVRSWAHGLTLELVEMGAQEEVVWKQRLQHYLGRYDKGKPRKPTRLQRLLLEWSRDRSWRGLLLASDHQPHLWDELETALSWPDDSYDASQLQLASRCQQHHSWLPWRVQFEAREVSADLLELLAYLPHPCLLERAAYLAELAKECCRLSKIPQWAEHLGPACRPWELPEHARLLSPIGEAMLRVLGQSELPLEPTLIGLLPKLGCERDAIASLVERDESLGKISYGPRPGTSWLKSVLASAPR